MPQGFEPIDADRCCPPPMPRSIGLSCATWVLSTFSSSRSPRCTAGTTALPLPVVRDPARTSAVSTMTSPQKRPGVDDQSSPPCSDSSPLELEALPDELDRFSAGWIATVCSIACIAWTPQPEFCGAPAWLIHRRVRKQWKPIAIWPHAAQAELLSLCSIHAAMVERYGCWSCKRTTMH